MARPTEQFRPSDVTFWGIGALAAWGLAILFAGASALLPNGFLSGLHTPLTRAGTLGQLQAQVAALQSAAEQLTAGNKLLMQRVALGEQASGDVTRRVGALEISVPKLIEAVNTPPPVDTAIVTGSTSAPPPTLVPVAGGALSYTTTPLAAVALPSGSASLQPMPGPLAAATPDPDAFGVALGPPILATEGPEAWKSMGDRAGTLLVGLSPLVAPIEGAPGHKLVAGPLQSESDARALCGGFARLGIACSSVPFVGVAVAGN